MRASAFEAGGLAPGLVELHHIAVLWHPRQWRPNTPCDGVEACMARDHRRAQSAWRICSTDSWVRTITGTPHDSREPSLRTQAIRTWCVIHCSVPLVVAT